MQITTSITGLDALLADLDRAPDQIDAEARDAMERSVLVAEGEVVTRTPTNKVTTGGRLRNAIFHEVSGGGREIAGRVAVSPLPYDPIVVEEDTKPHVIRPRRGKALRFRRVVGFQPTTGRAIYETPKGRTTTNPAKAAYSFVRLVHHPGTRGAHMFRDGWAAAKPQVERLFEDARDRVVKALAGR